MKLGLGLCQSSCLLHTGIEGSPSHNKKDDVCTNFKEKKLGLVWYVCLNNSFQFFFFFLKYMWVKRSVKIHIILFKN